MNEFHIDNRSLQIIKEELAEENADAVRIYMVGGGCCQRFEMALVHTAPDGDVQCKMGGVTFYVEKNLADTTSAIHIRFDKRRGLLIDLSE